MTCNKDSLTHKDGYSALTMDAGQHLNAEYHIKEMQKKINNEQNKILAHNLKYLVDSLLDVIQEEKEKEIPPEETLALLKGMIKSFKGIIENKFISCDG